MRRPLAAVLSLLALVALAAPPAAGAAAPPAALGEAERAAVARIEAYLGGLGTLKGRFLQVASSGGLAEGTFYLSRPGRFRFEYDPPVPVLIVADGSFVIFRDSQLKQTTHIPIGATPLGVLLKERVRLSGEVSVTRVWRSGGLLRVELAQTEAPERGSLTLTFSDGPLRLRQWTTVDGQGVTVTVSLSGVETGLALEQSLFVFTDPEFLNPANAN
ncbi:MAG: outer membrane lipoprotein carrier protein LolA [Proteobacteria bacterium]|nr:outer membrane lipoprotein carrier protein LolA [Pseudomonadota bacterium]